MFDLLTKIGEALLAVAKALAERKKQARRGELLGHLLICQSALGRTVQTGILLLNDLDKFRTGHCTREALRSRLRDQATNIADLQAAMEGPLSDVAKTLGGRVWDIFDLVLDVKKRILEALISSLNTGYVLTGRSGLRDEVGDLEALALRWRLDLKLPLGEIASLHRSPPLEPEYGLNTEEEYRSHRSILAVMRDETYQVSSVQPHTDSAPITDEYLESARQRVEYLQSCSEAIRSTIKEHFTLDEILDQRDA